MYIIGAEQGKRIEVSTERIDNEYAAVMAECAYGDIVRLESFNGNGSEATRWIACDAGVLHYRAKDTANLEINRTRCAQKMMDRGTLYIASQGEVVNLWHGDNSTTLFRGQRNIGQLAHAFDERCEPFRDGLILGLRNAGLQKTAEGDAIRLEYVSFDDKGKIYDRVTCYRGTGTGWSTDGGNRIFIEKALDGGRMAVVEGDRTWFIGARGWWHMASDDRLYAVRRVADNLYVVSEGGKDRAVATKREISANKYGFVAMVDGSLVQVVLPREQAIGAAAAKPTLDEAKQETAVDHLDQSVV